MKISDRRSAAPCAHQTSRVPAGARTRFSRPNGDAGPRGDPIPGRNGDPSAAENGSGKGLKRRFFKRRAQARTPRTNMCSLFGGRLGLMHIDARRAPGLRAGHPTKRDCPVAAAARQRHWRSSCVAGRCDSRRGAREGGRGAAAACRIWTGSSRGPRTADDKTLSIGFVGWDRSGPEVQITPIEPQLAEIDARLVAA